MSRDAVAPAPLAHRAQALSPSPTAPELGHHPRCLPALLPCALHQHGTRLGPCPPKFWQCSSCPVPPLGVRGGFLTYISGK